MFQDGDLDRIFGNGAAPKDSARASKFWKQVFQDGDLDRTFGSRCSRMVFWIGLLGAGVPEW